MKSIYQMELEDKFNRKIKYREKKIETQRKIIGKQQEEIERLNNIINELALLFDDYMSFVEVLEKYNYKLKGDVSNKRTI